MSLLMILMGEIAGMGGIGRESKYQNGRSKNAG
jgi:hypothetical protein